MTACIQKTSVPPFPIDEMSNDTEKQHHQEKVPFAVNQRSDLRAWEEAVKAPRHSAVSAQSGRECGRAGLRALKTSFRLEMQLFYKRARNTRALPPLWPVLSHSSGSTDTLL